MIALDIIYVCAIVAISPWLIWRRFRLRKNRRGLLQKLLGYAPASPADSRTIWLHAVSVGEINLLAGLIRELERRRPGHRIVVSTTTETGFDRARQLFPDRTVFFFPFDFSWAVKKALGRIRPELLILAELELWPNLLAACQRRNIPVAVVNARMSDRSFARYQRFPWLAKPGLRRLSIVAAQTPEYAERFAKLGVEASRIIRTGNIKFDGANTDRKSPSIERLRQQTGLDSATPVFVAGSTQPDEDEMVIDAWQTARLNYPGLILVVVPRHPHNAPQLLEELQRRKIDFTLRSNHPEGWNERCWSAIVVDVIGELSSWWGVASMAFVGGSMGRRGGQNMIEPAALGVPTSFGPNTSNFRDVVAQFTAEDAATIVRDSVELATFIQASLKPEALLRGQKLREIVFANQGATERTVSAIGSLFLPREDARNRAA